MLKLNKLLTGEWSLVVYTVLIVLTPLWKVPGIPALRLDDGWLLLLVFSQICWGSGRGLKSTLSIPTLSLGTITFMSVLTFVVAGYFIPSFFSVFSTLRICLLIFVIHRTSFSARGVRFLEAAIVLVAFLNAIAAFIHYYHIAPFDLMLIKLYTSEVGYEKYSSALLYIGHATRSIGTMGNPNYMGFLLAFGMLATVNQFFTGRMWAKVIALLFSLAFGYTIIFYMQSRSALVMALVGIVGYVCIFLIKRRNVFGYLILMTMPVLVVLTLVLCFNFSYLLPARIAALFQVTSFEAFLYEGELMGPRMNIWTYQVQQIFGSVTSLIFGHMPYAPTLVSDNGFMNVWYRAGLFAFVAYLVMQVWIVRVLIVNLARAPQWSAAMGYQVMVLVLFALYILSDLNADTLYSAKWAPLVLTYLFVGMKDIHEEPKLGPDRSTPRHR